MTETPGTEPGSPRGVVTPRSTLWRGILGSAPVVSSALALELGRELVINSFGDTEVVKTLATTLRSLAVAIVVGGLLFAGYRWYARRSDGERRARQWETLLDLDEPGPEVTGTPPPGPAPPPIWDNALNGRSYAAAVLRDLPPDDYDSAALLAVLTAIMETPSRLPSTADPTRAGQESAPRPVSATDLLVRLETLGVLVARGTQRYALARVPETPPRSAVRADPAWGAAMCALLRYHADHAGAWVVALDHPDYAGAGRRWFAVAAPGLHALVRACCPPLFTGRLPASALPELVRLVDALEVYYVARGTVESTRFADLCAGVAAVDGMKDAVLHHDLLRLRSGAEVRAAPPRYRPLRWSTGLSARWYHERYLRALAAPRPDLVDIAHGLERVWWLLPRADVGGEVCTLINLAVVELRRGRLDAARDRLDLVFARTEDGREPGGRVHAHEITGVLHWMRGEPRRALRSWQAALTGYLMLHDQRGIGRCLRHLGSALVVAPEHGGLVVEAPRRPEGDPPRPLHHHEVWREASGWLVAAGAWSPLDPAGGLAARDYLAEVTGLLAATPSSPRTGIGSWPIPVRDPDLRT